MFWQCASSDDVPQRLLLCRSVLAVLLLDANNFAARALREALPGERGQRNPLFLRLRASAGG